MIGNHITKAFKLIGPTALTMGPWEKGRVGGVLESATKEEISIISKCDKLAQERTRSHDKTAGNDMALTHTETLKEISAVYVRVEDLSDGDKVLGLANETIQTDVELKLRLAGMRVVTEAEAVNLPGSPCVGVRTFVASANVAFVDIKLMQYVWLDRNTQFVFSPTWQRFNISVGENLSTQHIRDQIKDLVDMFLNAWLSVNPKK